MPSSLSSVLFLVRIHSVRRWSRRPRTQANSSFLLLVLKLGASACSRWRIIWGTLLKIKAGRVRRQMVQWIWCRKMCKRFTSCTRSRGWKESAGLDCDESRFSRFRARADRVALRLYGSRGLGWMRRRINGGKLEAKACSIMLTCGLRLRWLVDLEQGRERLQEERRTKRVDMWIRRTQVA